MKEKRNWEGEDAWLSTDSPPPRLVLWRQQSSSSSILSGGGLQVGKAQEDLLQRDLAHRVIIHSIPLLGLLQDTKYLFETEKLLVREPRSQRVSPLIMGGWTSPYHCPLLS